MLNEWEPLSLVPKVRPPGPVASSSSKHGLLVWESGRGFRGSFRGISGGSAIEGMESPELGALSHAHHVPESWKPSLFSWACPLFKWHHDVETQSTGQRGVQLICMHRREGQRAPVPSLTAVGPPRHLHRPLGTPNKS